MQHTTNNCQHETNFLSGAYLALNPMNETINIRKIGVALAALILVIFVTLLDRNLNKQNQAKSNQTKINVSQAGIGF